MEFPSVEILKFLDKENNFVFLESTRCDEENYLSYLFFSPKKIVSTCRTKEIKDCFTELEQALKEGSYVAGFISYEAGSAFEERLKYKEIFDFPLLWFGVYEQPLIYNHRQQNFEMCSARAHRFIKEIGLYSNCEQKDYILEKIRSNISESSYIQSIDKIKDLIAQGLTYQVNYTFKLKFAFSGSAANLYFNLRNNQSVSYSAFIKAGHYFILSFSPELFFSKKGSKMYVRPMKGTAKRGRNLNEDQLNSEQLKNCHKNRSENIMIVDLLRNDLGRISGVGSVRVPRLFKIEKYETLFQMTSDIESCLKSKDMTFDIFRYVFPSGSVTGAPKIKTMEIIRQLEKEPRNIYTGSIGFFSPHQSGTFNVAIRTILINDQTQKGEMGVGSGIVYDSSPQAEYSECCLKTNFLLNKPKNFALIETMLWQRHKGFHFLEQHLKRLEDSAQYFDFSYKKENILPALSKLEKCFEKNAYKVRLLLDKNGEITLTATLLISIAHQKPKVYLATQRTSSQDPFLYHKTTNRKVYDQEYKRCKRLKFYDVIFTNEKGEITEGAISNLFIKKNGKLYTPPITSGLLDGIYRRHILSSRKLQVEEKVLFKKDLFNAQEIYLCNSVRGLVRVYLETKNH
jgi:para-aminobenzoate synthetase/4-amino-4-deoxychorismate lyase